MLALEIFYTTLLILAVICIAGIAGIVLKGLYKGQK